MKKANVLIFTLFNLSILITIILGSIYLHHSGENFSLIGDEITVLDDNWIVIDNTTGESLEISLPCVLTDHDNNGFTLIRSCDITNEQADSIALSSYCTNTELLSDDTVLASTQKGKTKLATSTGNQILLSSGQDFQNTSAIVINVSSQISPEGTIYVTAPIISTKAGIMKVFLQKDCGYIILSILILVIGIVTFIFYLMYPKNNPQALSLFYLGCLSVLIAVHTLFRLSITQFVIPNPMMLHAVSHICYALTPLPILEICRRSFHEKISGYFSIFAYLTLTNAFLQIFVSIVFGIDYAGMILISHLALIFSCILIFTVYFLFQKKNQTTTRLFLSLIPVFITAIFDVICYLAGYIQTEFSLLPYGIFLFLGIQLYYLFRESMDSYLSNLELDIYKKLAFTDSLTKIASRTAFNYACTQINACLDQYPRLHLVLMDLNNLKYVNDQIGHDEGDRLLTQSASMIQEAFHSIGSVYRYGGDEFIVIALQPSLAELKNCIKDFNHLTEEYNQSNAIKIKIALGYSKIQPKEDTDILQIFKRADANMYENKRTMKQEDGTDQLKR